VGLELDHVFCFAVPDEGWLERARGAGFVLDDGIEHQGQGTRNRRLWFDEQYLELVWISSRDDAVRNPLRLDRRADWRTTGACPFGIGLRGLMTDEQRAEFWEYRPPYAPAARMLIHRSNEDAPEQPFVFANEAPPEVVQRYLPRNRLAGTPELLAHARPAAVREVRLELASAAPSLLEVVTPPVRWKIGPRPRMEVVIGDGPGVLDLTDLLSLVG
jgi:hypothetical protein